MAKTITILPGIPQQFIIPDATTYDNRIDQITDELGMVQEEVTAIIDGNIEIAGDMKIGEELQSLEHVIGEQIDAITIETVLAGIPEYANRQSYTAGTLVKYDGSIFKTKSAFNSHTGTIPGVSMNWENRWDIIIGKPNDTNPYAYPDFDAYRTYKRGDTVNTGDDVFECHIEGWVPRRDNPNNRRPVDGTAASLVVNGITVWSKVLTVQDVMDAAPAE